MTNVPTDTFGKPITLGSTIVFHSKAGTGAHIGVRRVGIVIAPTATQVVAHIQCLDEADEVYFGVPVGAKATVAVMASDSAYTGFDHVIVIPQEVEAIVGCKDEADFLRLV